MNDDNKKLLAILLNKHRTSVLEGWKKRQYVRDILIERKIDTNFFIQHFGLRIFLYFITILNDKGLPGQCPIVSVMLKFFTRRGMMLDEVYLICSGMRNTIVDVLLDNDIKHSDEVFTLAINLFDLNFAGVIKEYLDITYKQDQTNSIKSHEGVSLSHTIDTTNTDKNENESSLENKIDNQILDDYFAHDEDQGENNILFLPNDADELLECFNNISELLASAINNPDSDKIEEVANIFSKAGSILLHYSPYLDALASSMEELAQSLRGHSDAFIDVLESTNGGMLKLFDAVNIDMDHYIQRFSVESLAMKNSHHIHDPTTLSILQIISMFVPGQFEDSEIDFF